MVCRLFGSHAQAVALSTAPSFLGYPGPRVDIQTLPRPQKENKTGEFLSGAVDAKRLTKAKGYNSASQASYQRLSC
jgi:hypothetical protein